MTTQMQPYSRIYATQPPPGASRPAHLLQRKCACGGTPGPSGECEECRKKRLTGAGGFQAKLAMSQPGDQWEQEADRMAESVVRGVHSNAKPSPRAGQMMKQSTSHANIGGEVPPAVHETIRAPGRPLDPAVRRFMEDRFAYDFSQVRIHDDRQAAESARQVNALAYTVGRDVVFNASQYAPGNRTGQRLLAHELAHVVQQDGCLLSHMQRQPLVGGFPRGTNYRFDTYQITERDLVDRDIQARLRNLTPEQLRVYRDRVSDQAVRDFINKLLAKSQSLLPQPRDPVEDCLSDYASPERVSKIVGPQLDVFECYGALEEKAAKFMLTPEAGCIQCLNNSVKMDIDKAHTLCRDRLLNSCIEVTESWQRFVRKPF